MLRQPSRHLNWYCASGKRVADALGAATCLVALLPLLLLIALLVKLTSKGPVLFRQERMGQGYRPFQIYKFRTMRHAKTEDGRLITVTKDPRITRIGDLLRATKLDELPQLINVVKGEMSFVGPRPEVRRYADLFRADYEQILQMRPGITDLGSIRYRDEAAVLAKAADPEDEYLRRILPEKIALARLYRRRASLLFDLAVIFLTVRALFRPPA